MNTQTEFAEMVEDMVEDTIETSKTKKIPVSTKNMAPTIYAVGVE